MVSPGCGIAGLVIVVVLISMLRTQLFGEFFLLTLTLIALSVIGFLWGASVCSRPRPVRKEC